MNTKGTETMQADIHLTTGSRISGLISATINLARDIVRAAPHIFETKDAGIESDRLRIEAIISQVRDKPVRQIEDELKLSEYGYPDFHRGYSVHPSKTRPRSRREELARNSKAKDRLSEAIK